MHFSSVLKVSECDLISTCPPIRMEYHGSRFTYFREIVLGRWGGFLKAEKILSLRKIRQKL